jgi:hypothetical protein
MALKVVNRDAIHLFVSKCLKSTGRMTRFASTRWIASNLCTVEKSQNLSFAGVKVRNRSTKLLSLNLE